MHVNMNHAYDFRPSGMPYRPGKPMAVRPKPKPLFPKPFDPDELSKRLYVVLAEQKAHSERKRRARAEADRIAQKTFTGKLPTKRFSRSRKDGTAHPWKNEKDDCQTESEEDKASQEVRPKTAGSNAYSAGGVTKVGHYVPQVAAAQFKRTTIAIDTTQAHKLSKKAIKFHMKGPNAALEATSPTDISPLAQAQAIRIAHIAREQQYKRNQFQHPSSLGTSEEADIIALMAQQRPVDASIDEQQTKLARRMSTGSMLGKALHVPRNGNSQPASFGTSDKQQTAVDMAQVTEAHRVDWTQSDEVVALPKSPQLRKSDLKWTLRGRLGSIKRQGGKDGKDGRDEKATDDNAESTSPKSPPKNGFFSRFKR